MSVDRPALTDTVISDIAAQAAMFRLIVENTTDIIIRYAADRSRIYVSPACRIVLGFSPEEMIGSNASNQIHPEDFAQIHHLFLRLGRDRPVMKLTFRTRHKDGHYVWVENSLRYVVEDGTAIAVMRDITTRKTVELLLEEVNAKLEDANARLRTIAHQDGLTGLPNRRRFDEVMDQEFRRASRHDLPLAVMLLDVDCFKAFNDRYGHLAGDDCLRRIARAIEGRIGRPGDIAARFGGEEFVVLLPASDIQAAFTLADRMRVAVEMLAIEHLGSVHGIATISIGVSVVMVRPDTRPEDLLEAADRALYRAKAGGRNRVEVTDSALVVAADKR